MQTGACLLDSYRNRDYRMSRGPWPAAVVRAYPHAIGLRGLRALMVLGAALARGWTWHASLDWRLDKDSPWGILAC